MGTKNACGFTLIELLVVIAIIAILAAILFPVFARVKEQAKLATCINNLKQISFALQAYVDDSSGRLPNAKYFGRVWYLLQVTTDQRRANAGSYVQDNLANYVKNQGIWLCPSLKPHQKFSRNPDARTGYDMSVYAVKDNCGSTIAGRDTPTNYMWMHYRYSPSGRGNADPYHSLVSGEMVSKIKQASKVMIFLEFPYWAPSPHGVYDTAGFHVADNVAYYDGHVKLNKFPEHAWAESYKGWE